MDPGIPTLLDQVLERLRTDPAVTTILVGGIYDRPLQPGGTNVYGATPEAFVTGNKAVIRPSAVVRTLSRAAVSNSVSKDVIELWLYAPRTGVGKQTLARAAEAIRTSLNGWLFGTWSGTGGVMAWTDQTGYRDDPVYTGSIVDTIRYSATYLSAVPS